MGQKKDYNVTMKMSARQRRNKMGLELEQVLVQETVLVKRTMEKMADM